MKTQTSHQQRLSRRLLANYLMFGLLSIFALATSVMLIVLFSSARMHGRTLLSRLGTAAEQITSDFETHDANGLQSIVEQLGESADLQFCCIVSNDGTYLAHTNRQLVGRKAVRSFPATTTSSVIERVSYLTEGNTGPREYWIPLRGGKGTYGMLQAGVPCTGDEHWVDTWSRHSGAAVMVPLVLLVLGGVRLNSMVKSTSAIERQLSLLSKDSSDVALQPVEVCGPASLGWNRLAMQSAKRQLLDSLESRLSEALGGFREEKYEQVLQGLTDGVAATNADGTITFANNAFSVLLNADPETICDTTVEESVVQTMHGDTEDFRRHMQEPSRPAVFEIQRSDDVADGVLRIAHVPMCSEDGNTLTQVWSVRDITQQKLVEYSRDQFVETATHELRTPLSTIKSCAETLELEEDIDLELQKQYLNTINMEATRLGRFVDEFLNVSRMEAGSLAVNRREVDFARLLSDVIDNVRPQMDNKKIDFQVLLPSKLPQLKLDKEKISAALINLLGNAAKYTPKAGRVKLQVELGGSDLRLDVEDTGIGIAAEDLPKVFNKFFRADDDRVRDVTGTGLGLAFAQEVVRLHGGRIVAHSEINQGSRFTVSLALD